MIDATEKKRVTLGTCLATNRIMVDGAKVGFMAREEPDDAEDSGWRFTAGDESADYMSDPDNSGTHDVEAVCTIDPSIIKHLHLPPGTALGRSAETGEFVEETFDSPT